MGYEAFAMLGALLLLAIVVFGLLIMFGRAEPDRYYKFLIFLIIGPILLSIGFNHLVWFWLGLPLWAQVIGILLLPFFFSAILRIVFPNAKWLQQTQAILFQTLVYLVTFPVRLLWRAGRLIFERERNAVRLNPYNPVVGGRAPVIRERERDLR
jgi:hypothetical protein